MTQVVLFDLGGVLVELGGVDDFGQLIGVNDSDEIWRRWLTSPWVRRYETGRCTRHEFAAGMVEENGLSLEPDEFLVKFRDWPRGLLPGAREMLRGLVDDIHLACLSNTNEMHWAEQRDAHVVHTLFESAFLSHEIGLVKPDREIFEHVVDELDCRADAVLFFDDNVMNVDAARAAGLDAHLARGVPDALLVLTDRGLHAT